MCVCVHLPGRVSVRGGPRQPPSTCKSVRTTCEPWTCLMNSAALSLTTWLKDNTWASNRPQLSSPSSSVGGEDSFSEDSKKDRVLPGVRLVRFSQPQLFSVTVENGNVFPSYHSYPSSSFHSSFPSPPRLTPNRSVEMADPPLAWFDWRFFPLKKEFLK